MSDLPTVVDEYQHISPGIFYVDESIPSCSKDADFNYLMNVHCECHGECCNEDCKCISMYAQNYNENLLLEEKLSQGSVIECGSQCNCSMNCPNRIVQKGPCPYLAIQLTKARGHGVFVTRNIRKGTFICEYAGEVIPTSEATVRMENFCNNQYILVLREHSNGETVETCVDATTFGNIGRYLNHSCSPNCSLVPVRVNSPVPKVCIFSNRDVTKGEELTYLYGNISSELSKTPCFCESSNCLKYLPRNAVSNDSHKAVSLNNSDKS